MAQDPTSSVDTQVVSLEKLWHDSFLAAAPLYSAASKVKLPYEDLKATAALYRGSLTDETRIVEQIADYRTLDSIEIKDPAKLEEVTKELATAAGHAIDGLIRLENGKRRDGGDIRDAANLRVVDVFEHADGRRNFNFIFVQNAPLSVIDPAHQTEGWIAYRFYFACARIRQEYQHATTKSY